MRLNRFMARAGIASRRKSDNLIRRGAVRVNGEVVAAPGSSVGEEDLVEVDGRLVRLPEDSQYLLLNKAAGTLVTHRDRGGRPTVFENLEEVRTATVAVGRLDRDTTGALLLTDDGELAHRLMHPRFEVDKRYRAMVEGTPSAAAMRQLRDGVLLDDGLTAPARVRIVSPAAAERPFVRTRALRPRRPQTSDQADVRRGRTPRREVAPPGVCRPDRRHPAARAVPPAAGY